MVRAGNILAAGAVLVMTAAAYGQTQPAQGGGRMNFDPAALRERIMQNVKTAVNCSEEEWKVLEPKLVKLMLLRMDTGEFGSMMGGRARQMRAFIRTMLDPNATPSVVDERL